MGIVATLATLTLMPLVTSPFMNLFCTTGLAICSESAYLVSSWHSNTTCLDAKCSAAGECIHHVWTQSSTGKTLCAVSLQHMVARFARFAHTSGKDSGIGILGPTFCRVLTSVMMLLCNLLMSSRGQNSASRSFVRAKLAKMQLTFA